VWLSDRGVRLIAIVAAVLVLGLIVYPLGRMLLRAFNPSVEAPNILALISEVASTSWFWPAVGNTVTVVSVSGFFAILIAAIFAWLNERTDATMGWIGSFIPILPLVVPAVAMSVGWVFLASPRVGFLNGMIGWLQLDITIDILTWPGLVLLYTLSLVPFAYVLLAAAFRNVDPALEEASRISGAGIVRTLVKVSIPSVAPAIVGSTFLVVVMGFGLYSIPLIIGGRANIDILSVRLVRLMTFEFPPQLESALIVGIFMSIPVLVAWLLQQRVLGSNRFATISGRSRPQLIELGIMRIPARVMVVGYLFVTSLLPLSALFLVAFQTFWTPKITSDGFTLDHVMRVLVDNPVAGAAIRTSLGLGLSVGAATMVLAVLMTLVSRRLTKLGARGGAIGRFIDGVTKLPVAFSNIVIALGFLVAFSGPPFYLNGTLLILVLCYFVLYIPHASIAAGSALSQVGQDVEEASAVSGAGEGRTFWRVQLPLMWPGLVSGWALVFVLISGDLEAAVLLASTNTPVIGFVIVDIWEYGTYGTMAAFVGVVTILKGLVVVALIFTARQRFRKFT
jgi:iron(III) transport system permease protein